MNSTKTGTGALLASRSPSRGSSRPALSDATAVAWTSRSRVTFPGGRAGVAVQQRALLLLRTPRPVAASRSGVRPVCVGFCRRPGPREQHARARRACVQADRSEFSCHRACSAPGAVLVTGPNGTFWGGRGPGPSRLPPGLAPQPCSALHWEAQPGGSGLAIGNPGPGAAARGKRSRREAGVSALLDGPRAGTQTDAQGAAGRLLVAAHRVSPSELRVAPSDGPERGVMHSVLLQTNPGAKQ